MTALNRHTPSTNPSRGPIRGEREINRRRMKAARPVVTPAIAFRLRQWCAEIELARSRSAQKRISKGADRYLKRIKGLPTVQAGGYADIRDAVMAKWLECSRSTVLRHRAECVAAGLIEDKGTCGRDHKPCLVRPILADQTPVFMSISATLSVAKLEHQQASLKKEKKEENVELQEQAASEAQGIGQALVAPDVVPRTPSPLPPEPLEKGLGNGHPAAAPEPITSPVWVLAESKAGMAWLGYWKHNRMLGCAVGRKGYFIVPLVSEFPPGGLEIKSTL